MEEIRIKASRIAPGSRFLFPYSITLDDEGIRTYKTNSVFTPWNKESEFMPWSKFATYQLNTGLLWDTLRLESTGGHNTLDITGLRKSDTRRIIDALEQRMGGTQQLQS